MARVHFAKSSDVLVLLEAWQPGESLVLVRNPGYHGRFGGNLERVELTWPGRDKVSVALESDRE